MASAFKSTQRGSRQMVTEENYSKGMQYTNAPLMDGYCKSLINFEFRDQGELLVPRPGLQQVAHAIIEDRSHAQQLHHVGQALARNTVSAKDLSRRYIFTHCNTGHAEYFDFMQGSTLLESSFSPEFGKIDTQQFRSATHIVRTGSTADIYRIRRNARSVPPLLHDIPLSDQDTFTGLPYLPVYTDFNGIPIMPVQYTPYETGVAKYGFAKMSLKTIDDTNFTNTLEYIEPREITPTEAFNYGYNMLKSAPYTFTDQVSAAVGDQYIIMQGVLPYAEAACTNLKFNARVGEWITFRMFYNYHDIGDTFKFRWEFRDINSEDVIVLEDQQKTARVFHGGDVVSLTVQPPFKQFGITVTAYSTADLTEPLQVMALASYSLSADAPSSTANLTPQIYNLGKSSDMCTWRKRMVLWGVPGADNMVFMSEVNDPSYFPYPNNAEVFDEPVVACLPYLGALLVFTESKLYKMSIGADGLTFSTEMIQDKLSLSAFDRETIMLVQNMVFFKNGNYFYMVVPRANATTTAGALQIAPISTPITYMLDHFSYEVKDNIFKLYNPQDTRYFPALGPNQHWDLRLQDYHNYLDTATVQNVYKFELILKDDVLNTAVNVLYLDFVLRYNTLTRAWNTYVMQTNPGRLLPYRQNVADATIYTNIRNVGSSVHFDVMKPNILDPQDEFPLDQSTLVRSRILKNHQLLDTGNRNHEVQIKKRYRELQFRIASYNQHSLQFGTAFLLDDKVRKDMFDYKVHHVTDEGASYGFVYVERQFAAPEITTGATILADADAPDAPYVPTNKVVMDDTIVLQSNQWVLDASQLADVTAAKVRFQVSGKGYTPRMLLVSFNDVPFELTAHSWVFRVMYAR